MSVIARPATADDIEAIAWIYAHHVLTGTATFEIEPPDVPEMMRRWRNCADRGWPWLVAERDGQTLGYAYAAQFRDRAAYARTAETSIYLDVAHTGAGIGRTLLEALMTAASAAGFEQLIAVIGESGNAASIAVHTSCGFQRVGLLSSVGRKFGRSLDVVYMQRGIGTANENASF